MRKNKKKFENMTVQEVIEWHKINNLKFVVTLSSYTTKIESNECDLIFIRGHKSKRCFVGFSMIKKDVVSNNIPEINQNNLKYYETALTNIYLDEVMCTDIKAAYANILYNEKVITEKTFNYITSLPKEDRLVAVGMLASRNNVYKFIGREIIDHFEFVSPLSNVFFFAVQKIYYIMNECRTAIKKDFLFTWVDCIYYANINAQKIVSECFYDHKLQFKEKTLTSFEVVEKGDCYKLNYDCDNKHTFFFIPKIYQPKAII